MYKRQTLKQISYKTDACQKSESKSTESEGGPVRIGSLLFFDIHPDCKIDEYRKGDEKEVMEWSENPKAGIGHHQGYTYIYKKIRQSLTIIVCRTISRHG